jgi:hypothetical protein
MNDRRSGTGAFDWRINEVTTDLIVTEPVGTLSPEDVRRIVAIVLDHIRDEKRRNEQRERDTHITDRAYRSDLE